MFRNGWYTILRSSHRDTVYHPFTIGFQNNAPPAPLQLNFNIPLSVEPLDTFFYPHPSGTDTIFANSTILLQFNCHGRKLMKIVYSLQDAKYDTPPQLKQIGNTNVNPQIAGCNNPGIGGTITTNTTYSNTTVYVTSDILLAGNTNLTFDKCIVVVSPNVQIKATPLSSIDIKNNTVMVGCNGQQWKGIYMIGNYNNGERLRVENSFIFNAKNPITTTKIPDLTIKGNVIANGETAISLDRSQAFTISQNTIGGFTTGIRTSNTNPNFVSAIRENLFMEIVTGIEFNGDIHNMLDIACNEIRFSNRGISSANTTLKIQGDSVTSAGNTFIRTASGQPQDYIDHTGTPTKYYFGPAEANAFGYPNVMNIPKIQAVADRACGLAFSTACKQIAGSGVHENTLTISQISIYPNPSSGAFTINFSNLPKGNWTLNVYDVLGQIISTRKVEGNTESINLQLASKGIYFVSIQNGSQRLTKKVIVE